MFNLAAAYFSGDGVGINDVEAYAWFIPAEDFGDESAAGAVKAHERGQGKSKG